METWKAAPGPEMAGAEPGTGLPLDAPRVLVAGGGIGGLAAAVALRRAGVDAQVYERAPELREVGAGISLWPNATRVLAGLGVLDAVAARSFAVERGEIRRSDGRVLQRLRFPQQPGAPSLLAHRAELHAALAAALPAGVLHLGAELRALDDGGTRVRAAFADGRAAEGDALVGADGLHSAVRARVLGDGPPVHRGYCVWRGVARLGREADGIQGLSESLGAGLRFGVVPIGGGRVSWWASANEPEGSDDGAAGRKARLLRLFGGWHDPIPRLLEATPQGEMLKGDIYDRPAVRGWGRGRVTLLGDAAHPTTPNLGQGGCMALEDAAVLARCVERHAGDLPAAFREFERRRAGRTAWITRQSRQFGWIGQWEHPWAIRLREGIFRAAAPLGPLVLRRMYAFEP